MSILFVDDIRGKTTAASVKMPAGHIIQTVHTSTNTQVQTSSGGFVETGLNLSITLLNFVEDVFCVYLKYFT